MIVRADGPDPFTVWIGFVVPAETGRDVVAVVGDFNDWDPTRHPFVMGADRQMHVGVELPRGRRYAFRYLAQDGQWFDEPEADDYTVDNAGHRNCVLDLTL